MGPPPPACPARAPSAPEALRVSLFLISGVEYLVQTASIVLNKDGQPHCAAQLAALFQTMESDGDEAWMNESSCG